MRGGKTLFSPRQNKIEFVEDTLLTRENEIPETHENNLIYNGKNLQLKFGAIRDANYDTALFYL